MLLWSWRWVNLASKMLVLAFLCLLAPFWFCPFYACFVFLASPRRLVILLLVGMLTPNVKYWSLGMTHRSFCKQLYYCYPFLHCLYATIFKYYLVFDSTMRKLEHSIMGIVLHLGTFCFLCLSYGRGHPKIWKSHFLFPRLQTMMEVVYSSQDFWNVIFIK